MALDEAVAAYKSGNYELAFSEFESADAADKAEAMFYLGSMYDKGLGVLKDSRKAAELFHQSAQGGYGRGCNAIGICYRDGDGVEKDIEAAIRWFEAGAQLNISSCYRNLGYIYDKKKQYEKAYSNWQKGADLGNLYCHHGIAYLYLNGRGVQPDGVKALDHYAKAQTKDNNTAYGMICVLEKYGLPDGYDPDTIISYARTEIDNNIITDGTILLRLGRIYQGLKFHNLKGLRPVVGKASYVKVGKEYFTTTDSVSSYQVGGSVHVTGGGSRTHSYKTTSGFIDATPTNKSYQISISDIYVEELKNGIDVCGLAASESKPSLDVKEDRVLYFYLPKSNVSAVDKKLVNYLPTRYSSNNTDNNEKHNFRRDAIKIITSKKVISLAAIVFFIALVFSRNIVIAFNIAINIIFAFFVLVLIRRLISGKGMSAISKKSLSFKSEFDDIMAYAFGSIDNVDRYTARRAKE